MIESLQSGASQAVKVMADSSTHREKAMEEVEQANASLQQISASIAHMNDMNTRSQPQQPSKRRSVQN